MFKENIPIIEFTSYKIGGPARYFFEARNLDELGDALREARTRNLEIFILGGGTNLLMSDKGFDGLILKPKFGGVEIFGNKVRAGAGVLMSELLEFSILHGLSGFEWAGGLPGTVGGAVRGNAGAFGGEMKDVVTNVRSFGIETHQEIEREASACDFGYRSSVFKKREGKEIILSAMFALKNGDKEVIRKAIQEKINYRRERHPLEYPNIGSIFKNVPISQMNADVTRINADTISVNLRSNLRKSAVMPVKIDPVPVVPAAYLISEARLKGVSFGGAMISPKQPNFIVNVLQAKASDVKTLIQLVKNEVETKFGITLEEEIIRV